MAQSELVRAAVESGDWSRVRGDWDAREWPTG